MKIDKKRLKLYNMHNKDIYCKYLETFVIQENS